MSSNPEVLSISYQDGAYKVSLPGDRCGKYVRLEDYELLAAKLEELNNLRVYGTLRIDPSCNADCKDTVTIVTEDGWIHGDTNMVDLTPLSYGEWDLV